MAIKCVTGLSFGGWQKEEGDVWGNGHNLRTLTVEKTAGIRVRGVVLGTWKHHKKPSWQDRI